MDEDLDFSGDMSATMAEIKGRESGGTGESAAPPSPPQSAEPPAAPTSPGTPGTPAPAAPTDPYMEFPKSWKKDYQAHWDGLSPEARKIIHEREKQAFEGISKYKGVADKWQETVSPYEKVFQQYGIEPQAAFRRLADAHLTLLYGTPEQKRMLAAQLNQDYGLSELLNGQQPPAALDPAIAAPLQALQQEVQNVRGTLDSYQKAEFERQKAAANKEVEAFFADKENEFAGEVVTDMMNLIKVGAASDLKSAYQQAIWNNPAIRATLIGREAEKIAKSKVPDTVNVRSSATPPAPTSSPDATIDDTLHEVYKSIQQRH